MMTGYVDRYKAALDMGTFYVEMIEPSFYKRRTEWMERRHVTNQSPGQSHPMVNSPVRFARGRTPHLCHLRDSIITKATTLH
jgi:hypothetical protein